MSVNAESPADAGRWWQHSDKEISDFITASEERRRAEYAQQVQAVAEWWGRTAR
jgi:hypothetical protein